jgi:sulfate transport system substrate-binding protein
MFNKKIAAVLPGSHGAQAADVTLPNVPCEPTRERYPDLNAACARQYKVRTGDNVTARQSHGGSGP